MERKGGLGENEVEQKRNMMGRGRGTPRKLSPLPFLFVNVLKCIAHLSEVSLYARGTEAWYAARNDLDLGLCLFHNSIQYFSLLLCSKMSIVCEADLKYIRICVCGRVP
jgi:hypothetical protein